jgi:hypothetical protein
MTQSKHEKVGTWQAKSWFDWMFVSLSFLIFVVLEAGVMYAYYVFLGLHLQ